MFELRCPTTLRIADARKMSTDTTLGGRVVAQLGAQSRRVWDCSIGNGDSADISLLQMLMRSLPMPWVWLSPWAVASNILQPDHSLWQGLSLSGATVGSIVQLEGGKFAPSLNDAASPTRSFTVQLPVIQGVPVTAGVHARPVSVGGSVTCRMTWVDAGGSVLSSNSSSKVCASSGPLTRVTVTATPPVGAVAVYVVATGHTVLAAPSITYTPAATAWALGGGCSAAVVAATSMDVIAAWPEVGGQRESFDFTVTEVG